MTERKSVRRDVSHLLIGPSGLHWDGATLTIDINETTVPLPRRLRGRVRVRPEALIPKTYALTTDATHRWRPIAPVARVDVDFTTPGVRWKGNGYLDTNTGDTSLEHAFARWQWSRADTPDGAAIVYAAEPRVGAAQRFAVRVDRMGNVRDVEAPHDVPLRQTRWGISRSMPADEGTTPNLLRTLESGPFYARSLVRTRLFGSDVTAVHESLSLNRFRQRWVQALLPFRMPRWG